MADGRGSHGGNGLPVNFESVRISSRLMLEGPGLDKPVGRPEDMNKTGGSGEKPASNGLMKIGVYDHGAVQRIGA